MCRKKFKDDQVFQWADVSDIVYVAALYERPQVIYDKVKLWGTKGLLEHVTYHDVYKLIQTELRTAVPD